MEMVRKGISRLAPSGRLPAYVDHPKQFLQQNVFRAHQLAPTYAVHEWRHAQPTTFGATIAIPWLIEETCACDHGRRARESQQVAPTVIGTSAAAAQKLWIEILQRSEDAVEPGSASCFCRVAFGYGLASTRREVSDDLFCRSAFNGIDLAAEPKTCASAIAILVPWFLFAVG